MSEHRLDASSSPQRQWVRMEELLQGASLAADASASNPRDSDNSFDDSTRPMLAGEYPTQRQVQERYSAVQPEQLLQHVGITFRIRGPHPLSQCANGPNLVGKYGTRVIGQALHCLNWFASVGKPLFGTGMNVSSPSLVKVTFSHCSSTGRRSARESLRLTG